MGLFSDSSAAGNAGYAAFISYKHHVSDGFTLRLEQALKSYAKPLFARPIRIFRDEKHLSPGLDLPKLIIAALDASEFLILLASPDAARSPWVSVEIDHWCGQLKRTGNLIVVLVDGEIATDDKTKRIDWTRTNALPGALEGYLDHVPLYVDLRNQARVDDLTLANPEFKTAINSLVARFRGIDPNEMLGEEIHQHRRALRIRNSGIGALGTLTLASLIAAYVAVTQREEAREQARIALSRQYAAEATTLLESDVDEAIFRAARAVTADETFEARNVLFQAVTHNPGIEAFLYRIGEGERPPVASFSPAGNELALAAASTLHVLALTEGGAPTGRTIQLSTGQSSALAYSRSGSLMAVGDEDGRVSVLRTADWVPVGGPITLTDQTVTRLFFSATDDRLFAVSDGSLHSVSVSARELLLGERVLLRPPELNAEIRDWTGKPTGRHRPDLTAVSADGRLLVTAFGRTVVGWDLGGLIRQRLSFEVRHQFTVGVRELALSPRAEMLVVDLLPGSDGILASYVHLYSLGSLDGVDELAAPVLLRSFTTEKALDNPTFRLAFNTAGNQLLIGDRDSRFYLIDVKAPVEETARNTTLSGSARLAASMRAQRMEVRGLSSTVHGPRFTPDDKKILLGLGTRLVLWNPRAPDKLSWTVITHDHSPSDIAFSPDGDRLVLASRDGFVFGWNARGKTPGSPGTAVTTAGYGVLTHDATQVSIVGDNELSLRDAQSGREIHKTSLEGWKPSAMSPDGKLIAAFREGILRVLSVPGFRELWRTTLYDQRQIVRPPLRDPGVVFSADSARMFVHVFGTAVLTAWNVASGRRVDSFETGAEREWDWAPVVSPDGSWIVTAANSSSVTIINAVTRAHETIRARPSVCGVAFSPDSARLAIAHESEAEDASDSFDGRFHPADYGVLFWSLADKRWDVPRIKSPSPPCHMAFSPDGGRLAIATSAEDDEPVQVLVSELTSAKWAEIASTHILYKPLRE